MDAVWFLVYVLVKGWWVLLGILSLMLLVWAFSEH